MTQALPHRHLSNGMTEVPQGSLEPARASRWLLCGHAQDEWLQLRREARASTYAGVSWDDHHPPVSTTQASVQARGRALVQDCMCCSAWHKKASCMLIAFGNPSAMLRGHSPRSLGCERLPCRSAFDRDSQWTWPGLRPADSRALNVDMPSMQRHLALPTRHAVSLKALLCSPPVENTDDGALLSLRVRWWSLGVNAPDLQPEEKP